MHEDAIPKGILVRLVRSLLIMLAMLCALTWIAQKLAVSDTLYGIGALVVFFLATLTDRTDFYLRPVDRDDR